MIKNTLSFVTAFTLAASVMAGGDDRDAGPVESLEALAPNVEKSAGNQAPEELKLTVGGKTVSINAHIACQSKLGLSESNISVFRKAQAGGYLYNTGPIDSLGTVFSPARWDDYFSCIDANGG
ncbi:hypothetical protein SPBRAN_979 [uncultured Candidatus Thioglobus sp.]|nr:hypothetical protein SPBRAN_979 [uncultured Candidatus Thioglobus sp.]